MEPRGEPGVPAQWTHEAAQEGKAHLEHPRTSSYVQIATGRRVRTEHVYDHLHVVALPDAQGYMNLEMEALTAAVIADSWHELRVCQEAVGSHFVSPSFVSRVQHDFCLVRIQSAALESSLNCWTDLVRVDGTP